MSITLSLSGSSSILAANYFPPIQLTGNYVCGLIDFHTYNSIPNVDSDNNLFHIGNQIIKIPVGSYEFDDIAEYLETEYAKSQQKNKENNYITIKANNNTLQSEIFSSKELIYFNKNRSIGGLLGFSKQTLKPNAVHRSDSNLMITDTNIIRLECGIVSGSYLNNQPSHILHEFCINVEPGYKIDEIPLNVIYLPVNTKEISSIIVRIVNQNGTLINFRGETISLRLHLKPQL